MVQPYDWPISTLKTYCPPLTRQADFAEFWTDSLELLAQTPVWFQLTPLVYPVQGILVYSVEYTSFGGEVISGYFARPASEERHPGVLLLHGYGRAPLGNLHEVVYWAALGYAILHVHVRGQAGTSQEMASSQSGGSKGWLTRGLAKPETYYYRAVYLDCVRAVEILAGLDYVDPGRICVMGSSQGGALALAVAALNDLPQLVLADYPFLSDFERAIEVAQDGPYLELHEYFRQYPQPEVEAQARITLSYFDLINLASRIQARTLISVGLIDPITPPSTIFALYNHLECPKDILVGRFFGHEPNPVAITRKLQALLELAGQDPNIAQCIQTPAQEQSHGTLQKPHPVWIQSGSQPVPGR